MINWESVKEVAKPLGIVVGGVFAAKAIEKGLEKGTGGVKGLFSKEEKKEGPDDNAILQEMAKEIQALKAEKANAEQPAETPAQPAQAQPTPTVNVEELAGFVAKLQQVANAEAPTAETPSQAQTAEATSQ